MNSVCIHGVHGRCCLCFVCISYPIPQPPRGSIGQIISPKIMPPLSHGDTLGSKGTVNITTGWSGTQFAGPTEGPGRQEKHPDSPWPDHTWHPRACGHTVRHCQQETLGQLGWTQGPQSNCLLLHDLLQDDPLWGSVRERSSLWSLWPCTMTGHLLARGLQLWHCTEGSGKQSPLHPWAAFLSTEEAI